MLSFKQRLKKRVRWTEITSFAAINNLLCIKSGPVAFLVLRLLIISLTSDSVSLEPPLPFIFLIAFQTFCVCVLEFNLEQK